MCSALLKRYDQEGDIFLKRIVSCDETWVRHYVSKCKLYFKKWYRLSCLHIKISKSYSTLINVLATIFWDSPGMVFSDFLEKHKTVITEYYSNLLQNNVKPAYHSNRRNSLVRNVSLLNNNACLRTAAETVQTLQNFVLDVLSYPYIISWFIALQCLSVWSLGRTRNEQEIWIK